MCYTDCFLIYFTIRAGSACVSSILLMFGLVGLVLLPLLPYSSNEMQFFLIYGYMVLLVAAFTTALCGTLTDSKRTLSCGLILGIIAFLVWMALTIPSIMVFLSSNNEFCLGQSCGESHWLVPRDWNEGDKTFKPTLSPQFRMPMLPEVEQRSAIDEDFIEPKSRSDSSDEVTIPELDDRQNYVDSGDDIVKNKQFNGGHTQDKEEASVVDMREVESRIPIGESANRKRPFIEPAVYDDDLTELADSILKSEHPIVKRDLMRRLTETIINEKYRERVRESKLRSKPINVNRFIGGGNSLLRLTRFYSALLAAIYACLFMFVLTTIFMNLGSYACREGELEDCSGYCPEGGDQSRTNSMMVSNM